MRKWLLSLGMEESVRGGHYHYRKKGLPRPVTLQTHIDPVPELIVRNALRNLGISKQAFHDSLSAL